MNAPLATQVAALAQLLDGTAITSLTLTEGGETITLRRAIAEPPAAPGVVPPANAAPGQAVPAPCPGILLLRHPLRAEPLATPGGTVAAGTVLALLRIGPLLVEIPAPCAGIPLPTGVEEGALVGYGTPLFHLTPEAGEAS